MSPGGIRPSARVVSSSEVHDARASKASRIAPWTCGEWPFQPRRRSSGTRASAVRPREVTAACWSPTETRGRSRPASKSRSSGWLAAPRPMRSDGGEPVGLGGRVVADQDAGGLPERDELGVHVLLRAVLPPDVPREESHPASPENCQGAKCPPGRAGVAIERANDSIAPRSGRIPAILTSGSTSPGLGSASPSWKSSITSVAT